MVRSAGDGDSGSLRYRLMRVVDRLGGLSSRCGVTLELSAPYTMTLKVRTEKPELSRMTVVVDADENTLQRHDQAVRDGKLKPRAPGPTRPGRRSPASGSVRRCARGAASRQPTPCARNRW